MFIVTWTEHSDASAEQLTLCFKEYFAKSSASAKVTWILFSLPDLINE